MCISTVSHCEVYYIESSELLNDADHHLTLSQFVKNSSNYLANDTQLIFAPGNHSLEDKLLVENLHSFNISVESISTSSRSVIVCDYDGRFEFSNTTTVNVNGVDFIGCFESYVSFVGHFLLDNSKFYSEALVNGTVLTIDESRATLHQVAFISTVRTSVQNSNAYLNLSESCPTDSLLPERATVILSRRSSTVITQSWFEGNHVGLGRVIENHDSNTTIFDTTFAENSAATHCYSYNNDYCCFIGGLVYSSNSEGNFVRIYDSNFIQNVGVIIFTLANKLNMLISGSNFINNSAPITIMFAADSNKLSIVVDIYNTFSLLDHSVLINNNEPIIQNPDSENNLVMNITNSEFIGNSVQFSMLITNGRVTTRVKSNMFTENIGGIILTWNGGTTDIAHSEFIDNHGSLNLSPSPLSLSTGTLIDFYGDQMSVSHCEFINNRIDLAAIFTLYYVPPDNLTITMNTFIDNGEGYDVLISSECRPGLTTSFGSSRCVKCPKTWLKNIIIVVLVHIIAGVAIVTFVLVLNLTTAVGTYNGILFYANIVATNMDTYFFPFQSPNPITVLVSWLNLEIGLDVCVYEGMTSGEKSFAQLLLPVYIIILTIIVIVASERSPRFARIIGKGNPVAVLATMILLSYTKIINGVLGLIFLVYFAPAYGSHNGHFTFINRAAEIFEQSRTPIKIYVSLLIVAPLLIFSSSIIYNFLITLWQFFVQHQDRIIFKWVRYQKLRHFIEPYHAPYTAKHRYWTGLLLFVRILLSFISAFKFLFDPHVPVEQMSTIIVIGALLLLKGIVATRVYKNWLLDVIETAIYFNLLAFSALTLYNVSSQASGNQIAVAYTSVMIIFILLLGVIVFHVFRYTRLYKISFVEKTFKWMSSKLLEKPKQQAPGDAPEVLDGYQLERLDDQELPAVTYSIVEIRQPGQNQKETAY